GREGMEAGEIYEALIEENEARCQPPLEEEELRSIAASAMRYEAPDRKEERYVSSVGKEKQTEALLHVASEAELWHTADGASYATFYVGDARQTWSINGPTFRLWLRRQAKERRGLFVNRNAVDEVVEVVDGMARFDGRCREVHRRVARHEDKIFIDICDDGWRTVEVDKQAWRIVADPPVYFVRNSAMKALPIPVPGGNIDQLRPFLNVRTDAAFHLCVAWLVGAFRPK